MRTESVEFLSGRCCSKPFLRASVDSAEEVMHVEFQTRSTVLASRDRCCINKNVKRAPSAPSVREQCANLLQRGHCPHARNVDKLSEQLSSICDLEEIDRVVAQSKKQRKSRSTPGCPYFGMSAVLSVVSCRNSNRLISFKRCAALKDRIASSTIIACPYQYLIDPVIRRTSGLDPILDGSVVICDEGHNIEDTACEAASFAVSRIL